MKAYYLEIKVGFVLELHQILLRTAAIFVPQGDENLNLKFGCLRNSVGTEVSTV